MADAQANINVSINTADALAQIRALQRQLSGFYSEMAKGGAGASAQLATMQQNLINGINSSGKFSASLTSVRSTTESFTNALEKNKLSMGEYFRYAGGSSKTFGKLFRTEFDTINKVARERVKTLQTQFIRLGRDANGAMQAIQVRPLALDMENLGTKVMMTAQKQQMFNQLVKQGSTNLLNFGKNTQWAGRQLMVGFTIPLSLFGAAAIREFQKIEEQAIKFRRVYGDMFSTDADADKALDNIRKLAEEFTKYGIAVEKTIDLAAKVAQMGNVGEALEQQVIQATRLSVLGGIEQQEALDTTISLTNAFGVSIEDLADKINFLNAAENQTILSIEDFNTAIPLAGSVVQQLGGDVEDLAFFLTAMREGGINASQGANALKTSLARLINPTTAAQERLREMGINVMGIVESNVGDLKGTVMGLAVELDKLDPLTRARAIEQLFGKFQFARMSTLFQNIVKEGSQANKVLQLTQNNTEELAILANRELGRVEESAATKFQRSLEKIQAALAPLGEEFLKAITPIVEFGTKLLNSFNNLSDGTKKFVTNIVGFVGLVAPVFLMGLGLVFNLIANGIKAFQFLGGVLLGLSGKSKILGSGLNYLSQEQLEGLAASGSLEQAHVRLQQAFTSEAIAVRGLIGAYKEAAIAQSAFGLAASTQRARPNVKPQGLANGRPVPGFSSGKMVPGYSKGVLIVPGKTSDGDAQPAMLTAGEAVISEPMTRKYGGLINAMISDNIPGYETSKPVDTPAQAQVRRLIGTAPEKTPPKGPTGIVQKLYDSLGIERVNAVLNTLADNVVSSAKEFDLLSEVVALRRQRVDEMGDVFAHVGSGNKVGAKEARGRLAPNDNSAAAKFLEEEALIFGDDRGVDVKHSWGMKTTRSSNLDLANQGVEAERFIAEQEAFGAAKWDEAFKFGGADLDTEGSSDIALRDKHDEVMSRRLREATGSDGKAATHFVDTREDLEDLQRQGKDTTGYAIIAEIEQSAFEEVVNDKNLTEEQRARYAEIRDQALARDKQVRSKKYKTEDAETILEAAEDSTNKDRQKAAQNRAGQLGITRDADGTVRMKKKNIEQDISEGSRKQKQDYEAAHAEALIENQERPPKTQTPTEQTGESFQAGVDNATQYVEGHKSVMDTYKITTLDGDVIGEGLSQYQAAQEAEFDDVVVTNERTLQPELLDSPEAYKIDIEAIQKEGVEQFNQLGRLLVQGGASGVEEEGEMASPSKRFFRLGQQLVQGMANGVEERTQEVTGLGAPATPTNSGGSKLGPPPPPPIQEPAAPTGLKEKVSGGVKNLGKKIGEKIDNSPIAQKLADKLTGQDIDMPGTKIYAPGEFEALKKAGQINTELRDKGFITDDMQVTASGAAAGIVPVRVVDGKLDIGEGSIDRLADVSPLANEAAEMGDFAEAAKDNRAAADQIANSNEDLAETNKSKQQQDKDFAQEDKRQKRQQRASRALGALGTATMVAGMATQVDGVVGEIAQQAVGPLAALSGIAPLLMALPGPLALLVALLGSFAAVIHLNKQAMEKAYDETYKLARSMGVGSEALQKFAKFAGTVGASEVMDRKRQERLSQFVVQPGKTTFGSAFTASDEGKEFVDTVRTSLNELGRDQTINSVFSQLGNAVAQNMLTQEQARSIAGNLGIALGDIGVGMEVNAKLIELLGPNGENLINDPLALQVKLAEIQAENVQEVMDEYLEKQKVLDPFTQMGGLGGNLELQVGAMQGGDLGALDDIVKEEKQKRYDEGGFWSDIATFFTPPTSIAEQIMQEQLGSVGAVVANSMGQQQQIIDAIRLQSEEKIAKAIADGATYEDIKKLREEEANAISDSIDAVNEQTKKSVELIDSLSLSDQKEQEDQLRKRLLDQELPPGVKKSDVGNAFDKMFASGDFKVNFLLSSAYEGGQFSFEEFKYISSLPEERRQIYYDISMNLGSGESSQLAQVSNLIKDEKIKADFELSFSGLKGSELTDAIAQAEELFKLGNMLGGDISIAADFALKNPLVMEEFMADLDQIKFDAKEGGFDANIELMTEIFGAEKVMEMQEGILANQAEFDALPDEMQLQYGAYFTLFADIAASSPEMQELMEQATGLKGGAAVAAYVMDYLPSLMPDMSSGLGDDDGPSGGGGGSPEAFDPLIKKLRDLRLATIDMKRGWDGMMQSLQKVFEGGTKSINVFDGLSNQIRKLGVGENLIEMIVGMDPDEYNKRKKDLFVFDKAGNITGVTAKLKNMQSAFNAIALGEYVNQQQRSLQSMRDQISAISILTANGLSLAEAYELVQDEALAAAIAMGATKEEIAEIIRLTKEVSSLRKRSEKEQERADASKAVRKTNEEFEKRVAVLSKLSKAVGQYTDAQIDAIFNDDNLQTLFLNPSIDSRALQTAINNAARNAQLQIDIQMATSTGRNNLFEEGFGKAMEAFSIQEQTIDIKLRANIAEDESIIRAAESQIAGLQFQLDDYEAEITRIEDQEKDINDAYEKRFEALDKIAQANEQIAAAQKSQLDIADALSRGDIAAAARAAQEARSQQADAAAKTEREQLERARDAQIAGLTGIGGLNREQLEQRIRDLQTQIFDIEESMLEPAQERIRLAQELRDEQVRSLEVLGKTREEWEAIRNSVDVARMNNWEFVESMQRALDLVTQIIEDLAKPKPIPPPPPPPAPSGGGGGGGGGGSAPAPASSGGGSPSTDTRTAMAQTPGKAPQVSAAYTPQQQKPGAPTTSGAYMPAQSQANKPAAKPLVNVGAVNNKLLTSANLGVFGKSSGGFIKKSNGGMIIPKRMAMGGKAKGYPMGGLIPYKAAGGFFKSLGSDTIPAMLTPGEFVVRRPAVRGFGIDNLEKINNGTYSDGSVYTYNLAVNVKSNSDPDRIARTVMKHIERVDSQKIRGNRI